MLDLTVPPQHPLVAASILSADFGKMAEDCRDVLSKGADLLHIDVMDGHFVPNLTMGADMIRALRKHFPDTFLDVHLMVERPNEYVDIFIDAGANLLSFHAEVCQPLQPNGSEVEVLVEHIRRRGAQVGLVVNPPTDVDVIELWLHLVDLVLIMSVNPGRSGQKFIPAVLEKAHWIREHLKPSQRLEMDGGLNGETTSRAVAAGVDVIVTASALFGADDRAAVIERMHGEELVSRT